ncbi:hypothetical protein CXF91_05800 (plasmid) [Planococcus sp. Urea-3u-39]|uniref:nucleotidyltransferase family protein n=1 Tax=Planococcus sp. Urea-3u-39 TaxID=2058328 RepID=UPI000C7C3747|nr:nucleotidyltransferase family protein [Planococcus sp. Urea-3u-39]PKG89697.1 hypothetical protein CXF91_05800 [Planococcus sp. Urea-3u-39]
MTCLIENNLENKLILLLSKSSLNKSEINLLRELMNSHMDWSKVMGLISFHRISGVSWNNIKRYILIEREQPFISGPLINYLEFVYTAQEIKSLEQLECIKTVCRKLENANIKYVIQKGIVLSSFAYKDLGSRVSNDTDIIVQTENVAMVQSILENLSYTQGDYDYVNKKVIPAQRKDLILSTLYSHEVYPFVKKTDNLKILKSHQVDIQFSIDLMTNNRTDSLVEEILARRKKVKVNGFELYTTDWEDLLFFTSIHFYKEASLLSEVLKYKDLLLYKISDLHHIINSSKININWHKFIERVLKNNFKEAIYFALYYVESVYENTVPQDVLKKLKPKNTKYLNQVFEGESLVYEWTDDISERVFKMNRPSILKKIFSN